MDIVKKINRIITLVILITILVVNPFFIYVVNSAVNNYDYYTYYITTADTLTLGWSNPIENHNPETDSCVVNLYNFERKVTYFVRETKETTTLLSFPKTGHWVAKAHMKRNYIDENGQPAVMVSADATSIDNGMVNNTPRGWWIFAWIAGTGPIDVSKKIEITGDNING